MDFDVRDRLLADYLYKLTDASCGSEMDRYESLLGTSSRLLTCDSIILVALAAAASMVVDHSENIAAWITAMYIAVIIAMAISLLLCVLCQWRFGYDHLSSPENLGEMIYGERDVLDSELQIALSYCKTLDEVYASTEKRNNKISLLLKLSIGFLSAAIIVIIILAVIIIF